MALRCLLFTSDMGTAAPICHLLADLAVEAEHCTEAAAAAENLAAHTFQIVIVDWDCQPEAGTLLKTCRDRKSSERPLTLAIVSADVSVPKALQVGANSILRKPILPHQAKDTLTTARDLLRARESAAHAAAAGAGGTSVTTRSVNAPSCEATLRAGEFLQSSAPAPATQFDTESEMQKSLDQSAADDVKSLKDLEPMAAAVVPLPSEPPAPPAPGEPRGLQWYLSKRAGVAAAPAPAAPAPPPTPAAPAQPELLGFDQTPSFSSAVATRSDVVVGDPTSTAFKAPQDEKRTEAKLFAYIDGENSDEDNSGAQESPPPRIGKKAIIAALVLAACAVVAAPQAPWHPQMRTLWGEQRQALHVWLNPQPVTTAPAPAAHEDFARAGDEYKLPVAEPIPDATTDPSQIRVTPMVDPTAKKPNNSGANADSSASPEAASANSGDPLQSSGAQSLGTPTQQQTGQESSSPVVTAAPVAPVAPSTIPTPAPASAAAANPPAHSDPFTSAPPAPVPQPHHPPPRPASSSSTPPIPSSLKSQMASMTPEASGNRAPETALPSIEPVNVAEAAERALVVEQPAISYPLNVRTQGTVVLQVLIGRDGTVQDAKFLQGSLAFARSAIEGVRKWKFKPYTLNGRAVSVQTTLTIGFKPGQ
jgi:periplasmic protein TonB